MQTLNPYENTFLTVPENDSSLAAGAREKTTPPVGNWNPPQQILNLREGEYVFKAGEMPKGIYMLKTGVVKIVSQRSLTRGRVSSPEFINKLVGPGEYFGFKALLQNQPYTIFAKALKASEIYVYSKDSFEGTTNSVAKGVILQMAQDLEGHERISHLHYLASVQERIAYQLSLLAEKFGSPTVEGISINLRLTRNELAQLAGTINESLSRHLTEFKNEDVIDVRGKEIIVKKLPRLKELSGNFKTV